jgi:TP901 family phage tail tape measure protein
MAEEFDINFNANDNVSSTIGKISGKVQGLSEDFKNLAKALEQYGKNSTSTSDSTVASSQRVVQAKQKEIETYSKLSQALSKQGLLGAQGLVPKDIIGAPIGQIIEFQKRLKDAGLTLRGFLNENGGSKKLSENATSKSSITQNVVDAQKYEERLNKVLATANALRNALGKPIITQVSGLKELFVDIKQSETEIDNLKKKIAEVRQESFKQLSATIKQLDAGSSIKGYENVINFQYIRTQASNAIESLNGLKASYESMAKAAASGEPKAVKEFEKLKQAISSAEDSVVSLNVQMQAAIQETGKLVSSTNVGLMKYGFKPITVNDIFPTQEQQKLESIKQRISELSKASIERGAVKDSINFWILKDENKIQLVDNNLVKLAQNLPRLRYALYDVSNTAAMFGISMLALPTITAKVAADFQRDFANVARTADLGDATDKIKKQFIDISKAIPVSFKELTNIGELAGQLNIGQASLANFTKSVAMFSATTDVSTTEAATAFGRLDQLIKGVNGQYENLGSSILAVGTQSVATESQIIRIAQQISSIANLAGFSADQVIALSGALASVGTTPELSRGMFTRLFTEINGALSGANDNLSKFANLAGQTAQEFSNNWAPGKSAGQIVEILKGLSTQGAAAEQTLRDLNIASVRDIPTVLKLAQNYGELERLLNLSQAAFLRGTELQKQYNVITSTLSEKLALLSNNFQALIATAGGSTSGLTGFVDIAIQLVGAIQHLLDNPITGIFVGVLAAIVATIGGLSLIIGAISRAAGAFAGLNTAQIEFRKLVASAAVQAEELNAVLRSTEVQADKTAMALQTMGEIPGVNPDFVAGQTGVPVKTPGGDPKEIDKKTSSFKAMVSSIKAAAAETGVLKGALIALTASTVIGLALTAITLAFDALGEAMKSAEEKAAKYFNNVDLTSAIKADTEEFNKSGQAISNFTVTASGSTDVLSSVEKQALNLADANNKLTDSTNNANASMSKNAAIGAATVQSLAQEFVKKIRSNGQNDPFNQIYANTDLWNKFANTGVNAVEVLNKALSEGGLNAAQKYINDGLQPLIDAEMASGDASTAVGSIHMENAWKIQLSRDALIELAKQGITLTDQQKQQIKMEQIVAKVTEASASAAESAASAMQKYSDAVASVFVNENAISKFADSILKLNNGLVSGGNSFDAWGAAGRTNISNIQDALTSAIAYGKEAGIGATSALAAVMGRLISNGASTVDMMQKINSIALKDPTLGIDASFLQDIADNKYPAITAAFMDVKRAEDEAAKSSKALKKELVTIGDYSSKLSSVWKDAFAIRFDPIKGLDAIKSGFDAIAKSTEDAKKEINGLNTDLMQLAADKSLQEYFLSVATSFGDTVRADQIRADLAKINSDIANKNSELATAQDKTNKTLVGNSSAAIANRSTIIGLASQYQTYIESLANSGMKQEDLSKRTEELRQDFINQGTQLGYSETELGRYATAFDDVQTAILGVDRNVSVAVDMETDPAKRKLAEIAEASKIAATDISTTTSSAIADANQRLMDALTAQTNDAAKKAKEAADAVKKAKEDMVSPPDTPEIDFWGNLVYNLGAMFQNATVGAFRGTVIPLKPLFRASGGYISGPGTSTSDSIPTMLSNGEYVIPASQVNQATKKPYFMEQQPRFFTGGSSSNGSSTTIVELSPTDRMLLAQAGNVQLSIDGRVIAGATNGANNVYAQRGSN